MYSNAQLYTVMYNYVQLCTVMYSYVQLCTAMYSYVQYKFPHILPFSPDLAKIRHERCK